MIDITQYRACIGHYYFVLTTRCKFKDVVIEFLEVFLSNIQFASLWCSIFTILTQSSSKFKLSFVILLLLILSGTVHPNPGPEHDLSICHINSRSLYAYDKDLKSHMVKIDEIESVLCLENKFDIICVSETWLSNKVDDSDIHINNYTIFRKDRMEGNAGHGGVALYVSNFI